MRIKNWIDVNYDVHYNVNVFDMFIKPRVINNHPD